MTIPRSIRFCIGIALISLAAWWLLSAWLWCGFAALCLGLGMVAAAVVTEERE